MKHQRPGICNSKRWHGSASYQHQLMALKIVMALAEHPANGVNENHANVSRK
jgi:hypothetical protein